MNTVHRAVVSEQTLVVLELPARRRSILGGVYGGENLALAWLHILAETLKLFRIGKFREATRTPSGPTLRRTTPS